MNKAARNERVKLMATWLNGAAVAALAIGCFAPITGYITATTTISPGLLAALVACWLVVSVCLHMVGRSMLGRIEE